MAEQPSRIRRIVRRAVWTLAVIVLLLSGYVSSDLAVHWLWGRGVIEVQTYGRLQATLFVPLRLYMKIGWPGGERIRLACEQCWSDGWDARLRAMGQ